MYTTADLLDSLKVRGAISSTGALFTTARLLALCTDEMRDYLLPHVLKVRENYYQWDDDTALNGTGKYPIHTRAAGGKLDNVFLIDSSPTPTRKCDLTLLTEDELEDYGATPGDRPGIFFKRNHIFLVPAQGLSWSYIRQQFFLRPGRFVETSDCAQITAVNTGTKTCTFDSVPSSWTTADAFDFIQAEPHFDTLDISKGAGTVTIGSGGSIVFTDALPEGLAVGDWVCLENETCIVQAPPEFHSLLAQRVANICLKTLGRDSALKNGEKDLERLEKSSMGLISPRVNREGKKLVNRTGLLRRR